MAMGSREWRDWLADWTRRYLDWGADGMYYDQFNMMYDNGRLYPDFDTYGCWMPATLELISRIRNASRAKNPVLHLLGRGLQRRLRPISRPAHDFGRVEPAGHLPLLRAAPTS